MTACYTSCWNRGDRWNKTRYAYWPSLHFAEIPSHLSVCWQLFIKIFCIAVNIWCQPVPWYCHTKHSIITVTIKMIKKTQLAINKSNKTALTFRCRDRWCLSNKKRCNNQETLGMVPPLVLHISKMCAGYLFFKIFLRICLYLDKQTR